MSIKTLQCVAIVCDRCDDAGGEDGGELHWSSLAEAVKALSEWVIDQRTGSAICGCCVEDDDEIPRDWVYAVPGEPRAWVMDAWGHLAEPWPVPDCAARRVYKMFGQAFVTCACTGSWPASVWLDTHFKGSIDDGAAILRQLVHSQSTAGKV